MEDQVPFKVYTVWRWGAQPEVCRFGVDRNVVSSYSYLLAKIHDMYPKLKDKNFHVSWKDEEGDNIKLSSDEDVMTMLAVATGPIFKLNVHVHNQPNPVELLFPRGPNGNPVPFVLSTRAHRPHNPAQPAQPAHPAQPSHPAQPAQAAQPTPAAPSAHPAQAAHQAQPSLLHCGVVCDSCNGSVIGFRYKCITCADFDLCANCESRGNHADHCVVRIPNPHIPLQVIKESIKMSRSFLKSFAASFYEGQKIQKAELKKGSSPNAASTSGCPVFMHYVPKFDAKLAAKERREDRQERQEKRQDRQDRRHREEERREKRENPRERASWMDIFTKYVDHFANMAADHIHGNTGDFADQTPQTAPNAYFDEAEFAKMVEDWLRMHPPGCSSNDMTGQAGGSQESSTEAPSDKPASAPSTSQAAATQQPPTTPRVETQAPAAPQVAPRAQTTPQAPGQGPATKQAPGHAPTTPQAQAVPQAQATPQAQGTLQAPTTPQASAQAPAAPLVPTQASSTPQAPATAPVTPQVASNPVKPVEDIKSDHSDSSSVSSAEVSTHESSPDKSAEGWTMINAEKDLEAETGVANPALMDANLPEEFRARAGAGFGFIYPPLNTATADPVAPAKTEAPAPAPTNAAPTVFPPPQYNHGFNGVTVFPPVQPGTFMAQPGTGFMGQPGNGFFGKPGFVPTGQPGVGSTGQVGFGYPGPAFNGSSGQGASSGASSGAFTGPGQAFGAPVTQAKPAKPNQSPPPAPAAAKPSAPVGEQRQHRVPHIDAAIRQMIAMGFTNEGGWLTQLVESKDGNIAAVLDLLTPVMPAK